MIPHEAQSDGAIYTWLDRTGRAWSVRLEPRRVILESGSDSLELPASTWARDILITPHGGGYIVRFDTFNLSVGFVVPATQAQALLNHIGVPISAKDSASEETPVGDRALLWPKVSPLAVWALISSSVAFVPVLGVLPAIVSFVLLLMHRRRVRRAPSWNHSRALCKAAAVFLLVGIPVSLLATWGLARNVQASTNGVHEEMRRHPATDQANLIAAPAGDLPSPGGMAKRSAAMSITRTTMLRTADPTTSPRALAQSAGGNRFWEQKHNWGLIAAGLFVMLLSLTVHEAAHAITAWWLGDDFARRLGRVTLNPLAHIDPLGTIVLPLVLFMMNAGVLGWARPVPVRTEVLDRPRRGHILISLAGPGSNLLLAMASLSLLLAIGCGVALLAPQATIENYANLNLSAMVSASGFALARLVGPVCTVLKMCFVLNIFLAFFNLIPIPPLDGSWVLEHLFPRTLGPIYDRIRPYGFLIFVLVIYSNLFDYLIWPALLALAPGIILLSSCTPF